MSEFYNNEYFQTERRKLIKSLKKKGISSPEVLSALSSVPRELFVADDLLPSSYIDNALPINCGQTISQPYTVAFMTQELNVFTNCKVLEIGTGSGYQSAILAKLGCDVYSIERIPELYKQTYKLFKSLQIDVKLFLGDGTKGLPEFAPFDRIIVTAAAPNIPKSLQEQLAVGGRMVIPVGGKEDQTMTVVIRRSEIDFDIIRKDAFRFVPLIGKEGWKDDSD